MNNVFFEKVSFFIPWGAEIPKLNQETKDAVIIVNDERIPFTVVRIESVDYARNNKNVITGLDIKAEIKFYCKSKQANIKKVNEAKKFEVINCENLRQ